MDDEWHWERFEAVTGAVLGKLTGSPVSSLRPEDHLLDDVGLDSFGLLELVAELETRLQVAVPASTEEPTAGALFRLLSHAVEVAQHG